MSFIECLWWNDFDGMSTKECLFVFHRMFNVFLRISLIKRLWWYASDVSHHTLKVIYFPIVITFFSSAFPTLHRYFHYICDDVNTLKKVIAITFAVPLRHLTKTDPFNNCNGKSMNLCHLWRNHFLGMSFVECLACFDGTSLIEFSFVECL